MSTLYIVRLVVISFGVLLIANAIGWAIVRLSSAWLLKTARRLSPGAGANLVLASRLAPLGLAVITVLALCLPSYLRFEPDGADEAIRFTSVLLAVLGSALLTESVWKAGRMLVKSSRYARRCRESHDQIRLGREQAVWLAAGHAPVLGLAGLFRAHVVISRRVIDALSRRELSAALRHEAVHRKRKDNWKRLFILSAPGLIPFRPALRDLDAEWARLTEYAADEEAAQGNPRRALALASALVRVASLGPVVQTAVLHTSLLASPADLVERVNRLLEGGAGTQNHAHLSRTAWFSTGTILAAGLIVFRQPEVLSSFHRLIEGFSR